MQGIIPLPLCDMGRAQLREIAEAVSRKNPDSLYNSGNESSGATAEYLGSLLGLKPKRVLTLRELNCGIWQGLQIDQISKRYGRAWKQWRQDPTSICPPQGECVVEAYARTEEALRIIWQKSAQKTVVVVAAQIISGLIECILTQTDIKHMWTKIDNAAPLKIFDLSAQPKDRLEVSGWQPKTMPAASVGGPKTSSRWMATGT